MKYVKQKEKKGRGGTRGYKGSQTKKERERSEGQTETERWFKIAGGWKLIFRAH